MFCAESSTPPPLHFFCFAAGTKMACAAGGEGAHLNLSDSGHIATPTIQCQKVYPGNSDCKWFIQLPDASKVTRELALLNQIFTSTV